LHSPDNIEHLSIEDDDGFKATFATKSFETDKPSAHTLIVDCQRMNDVLTISSVWKALHCRVKLSRDMRPVEMLEAFSEVYGLDLSIGDKSGKFIWHANLDLRLEPDGSLSHNFSVEFLAGPDGVRQLGQWRMKKLNDIRERSTEVRLAYTIDLALYESIRKLNAVKEFRM